MSNPFGYFNSSPEVIRLVVMMNVRYQADDPNYLSDFCRPRYRHADKFGGVDIARLQLFRDRQPKHRGARVDYRVDHG